MMTSVMGLRRWLVGGVLLAGCAAACGGGAPRRSETRSATVVRPPAAPPLRQRTVDEVVRLASPADEKTPVREAPHSAANLLAGLPRGAEQMARLCKRGHPDRIAKALCAKGSSITGLVDLQRALGLAYVEPKLHVKENLSGNGHAGNPAFAFLGHSTSLTARLVSPINPRVIVFTPPAHTASSAYIPLSKFEKNPSMVAMAFTRGEQTVELVDRDTTSGDLRFFLLRFEQACNARPGGCSHFELFTPAIETDWTGVTLYDDTDLENTPADCNVCHQPDGHGTARKLLMQSRRTPWTHYFRYNRPGGEKQLKIYRLAHDPSEAYGGIPGSEIPFSDPMWLQGLVENEGFMRQPVSVFAYAADWGIADEALEARPELSLTWKLEYERARAGRSPGVAFPVVGFFDDPRLRRAAQRYRAATTDPTKRSSAPYLGDMHQADVRHRVSLAPPPGADGRAILVSMCRRCHNASRNPKLSRARFDVDALDTLPTVVLNRARERLTLTSSDARRMPPSRFGDLSSAEIEAVDGVLDELLRASNASAHPPD